MPKVCVPHRARCAREGGAPHSLWPHWAGLSRHHTCPRDVFINQAPRSWVGAASHRGSPRSCLIHHPRSVPSQCRVHRITRVPGGSLGQQAAPPACWSPVPGARGGAAGVLRLVLGGGGAQSSSCTEGHFQHSPQTPFRAPPCREPPALPGEAQSAGVGPGPHGDTGAHTSWRGTLAEPSPAQCYQVQRPGD